MDKDTVKMAVMEWEKTEEHEDYGVAYLAEGYVIHETDLPPPLCWEVMAPDGHFASYPTLEDAKAACEEDKYSGQLERRIKEQERIDRVYRYLYGDED